ncbi:MAG: hypothetical protein LQ339_000545 [Xanthoria mediterranea]|nr:MAG: hypothetical protein LQ339_000545 [Xanthoria mediterranea]
MAPMKRLRPADNDQGDDSEESDVIGVETAQTNLRQDPRKKARLSYEISSAETSEESSDDEAVIEEQESSFRTQQQSSGSSGNTPADNGILESVTCSNFMCHNYLEVPLGPLINFIIGHNGSGKSAILTAITICLGGKATATNRGQSLKSFIKEGSDNATLSVKIKNKGDSSYQSEVYGDSIIVERHFTRSGTSNFKLKSDTGRLISTRKADLEEICDYFALQIDNPMNVLTQDMARQFLSNSTPQDKYKFFMKGTQLEHLDGDYLQIEQSIDRIDQDLAKNLADVGSYEAEARKAKHTLELSEKHNSLREKIRQMGWQMAWAQVEEVEQRLADTVDDLAKITEDIATAEQKTNTCTEEFDTADVDFRDAGRQVEELQEAIAPHSGQKEQAKQKHDRVKKEAIDLQLEQRKIKDLMKTTEGRIKRGESDIAEEHRRLEEINGGSNARRLVELDEKRSQLSEARNRLNEHDNGLTGLDEERRDASEELEKSKEPISKQRQEIQKCEERLNRLIKDKGKQEGAYYAGLPRLLRAIREDGGFQQTPIGPIGYHVQLKKPAWSSILEKSLGGMLNTFIVISKSDQTRLSQMMGRFQCQYPIVIGNNGRIDTTNHEPDAQFETVLKVLEIDEDLVRKQLVINQAIEQTLLIDKREEVVKKMNETRLSNVKQVYTHNARGTGLRYSYGWGGGLAQSFVPAWSGPTRMKTDVEYQVNSCRAELQSLRSHLNDLERVVRERQTILKDSEQAITRHKRDSRELRIELQRLEADVEGLQDALESDSLEEGRLDALKEGLQEAKEELVTHQASFSDSVVAIDKAKDVLRVCREEMTAIDNEVAEIQAKVRKAENKKQKSSERRDAALRKKNAAFADLEDLQKTKERGERQREDCDSTVTVWTEQANKIHPRVEVEADLQKWETRLGGNRQQIAEAAARKIREFQRAKKQVEDIERLAQLLKTTLVNRKGRWKLFQRAITARARVQFMWMLSERSFRGRLLANHKEKKLDLVVEPDPTKVTGKGREAKTLSGGEKSFATICLLLSLWDAMGAPVRCLDEFDVFMDSVNREVSMRKMIEAARYSIGKQFVLITPGSMGSVSSSHDVKIIKMKDPERGQTSISFPNQ